MARRGYHGSYDDLELGSADHNGERTLLADFGDAEGFERILAERGREIAAVFLEPILGSGGVITPPPGFLNRRAGLARGAGPLFVVHELIMLRLAPGGARQSFLRHPL